MSSNLNDDAVQCTSVRERVIKIISEICCMEQNRVCSNHRLVEDLVFCEHDYVDLDDEVESLLNSSLRPNSSRGIRTVEGVCDWVESNWRRCRTKYPES